MTWLSLQGVNKPARDLGAALSRKYTMQAQKMEVDLQPGGLGGYDPEVVPQEV